MSRKELVPHQFRGLPGQLLVERLVGCYSLETICFLLGLTDPPRGDLTKQYFCHGLNYRLANKRQISWGSEILGLGTGCRPKGHLLSSVRTEYSVVALTKLNGLNVTSKLILASKRQRYLKESPQKVLRFSKPEMELDLHTILKNRLCSAIRKVKVQSGQRVVSAFLDLIGNRSTVSTAATVQLLK